MLRWFCYALMLVLCYLLQTNRVLFSLGGIRPLWLAAACIVLACYEDVFPSVIFGLFAGLLWDFSANRLAGFFAGLMMVSCFICSSVIQLTLRRTVFNVGMLCLGCLFFSTGLDYLLTYTLYSVPMRGTYFLGTLIPCLVYTVAISALLYPLCRVIHRIGRQDD